MISSCCSAEEGMCWAGSEMGVSSGESPKISSSSSMALVVVADRPVVKCASGDDTLDSSNNAPVSLGTAAAYMLSSDASS